MKHCYAISAYGASPYLETCIESLTQQSVRSAVILCTSTPNDLIREMAARYAIPLYIRDGASSLHADWNFAVETAVRETGAELVTVAHQDDVYHRDYGKALRAAWHMYPDLSVFCTRYRTIDAGGEPVTGRAERVKRLLRLPLRMRELAEGPLSSVPCCSSETPSAVRPVPMLSKRPVCRFSKMTIIS